MTCYEGEGGVRWSRKTWLRFGLFSNKSREAAPLSLVLGKIYIYKVVFSTVMVTLAPVDGEVGEAGQVDGGEGGDGAVGAVEDVQALQAGTTAREPGWCVWWLSCWCWHYGWCLCRWWWNYCWHSWCYEQCRCAHLPRSSEPVQVTSSSPVSLRWAPSSQAATEVKSSWNR